MRSGELNLRQRGREPRLDHALNVENSSVCGQVALATSSASGQVKGKYAYGTRPH